MKTKPIILFKIHDHLHGLIALGTQPVLKDLLITTNKQEGQDFRSIGVNRTVSSIDFLQTVKKYLIETLFGP